MPKCLVTAGGGIYIVVDDASAGDTRGDVNAVKLAGRVNLIVLHGDAIGRDSPGYR